LSHISVHHNSWRWHRRTQQTYCLILEKFRAAHGDKPVALLTRQHINAMLGQRVATPAAANHWLRRVKALMAYAVEEGWRKDDPTRGIKRVKNRSDGFHTWTESKIAMFEARHPIGSKARLALALLLYTAQRRSDVGCQHIRDGVVHVRQQKTGATLAIPLHPGPRRHHRGQSERTPHLPYDELWEKFHSRRLWELVPRAV
jgi:site-specific recombinase XerD